MNQSLADTIAGVIDLASDPEIAVFTSLCTIQSPNETLGPSGQPLLSPWANVAGMVDIPCTAPPLNSVRLSASEKKSLAEILSETFLHVLLSGYYPAIQTRWRAVVDGTAWDILGVESDSQKSMTRMEVRIASL